VHPTGFVDPSDPDAGTKFLAPEKLRGVGGVLLAAAGQRFTDELATRNAVSAAIAELPGRRAFLLLGADSAAQFGPALGFYVSKGLMKQVQGWQEAAAAMGLPANDTLAAELRGYNEAAAAGTDAFGKSVFPAAIDLEGAMYLGQVEPVVHYTMGGTRIDPEGHVLRPDSTPLPGLFAAGEVAGGVHGRNRLGGNSLAE
jgi:succinate dehydrogenase/fumarate reductase flavoprotein subunit